MPVLKATEGKKMRYHAMKNTFKEEKLSDSRLSK